MLLSNAKSHPKVRLDKLIISWQEWQLEDRTLKDGQYIESIRAVHELLEGYE